MNNFVHVSDCRPGLSSWIKVDVEPNQTRPLGSWIKDSTAKDGRPYLPHPAVVG